MRCQRCGEDCAQHQLPQTELRDSGRLAKTGYWECEECGWTRPIWGKNNVVQLQDRLIQSISCHCCNDTGQIYFGWVRKYIMPEYTHCDPPVPCRRPGCEVANQKGIPAVGWDIATPEDCQQIHRERVRIPPAPAPEQVQQVVQQFISSF